MVVKKVKISAAKRANHMKTKKKIQKPLKSQAKIAKQEKAAAVSSAQRIFAKISNKAAKKKEKQKKSHHLQTYEDDDDDDEQIAENVRDIIDSEDESLLDENRRQRKRKLTIDAQNIAEADAKKFESEYATDSYRNDSKKRVVELLPIKSKEGEIITRQTHVEVKPLKEKSEHKDEDNIIEDDGDDEEAEFEDSDEDVLQNEYSEGQHVDDLAISTADLLIRRQQEIEKQKYRIGIICSAILEKPEDKIKNFGVLFQLMDEKDENETVNLLSVRKIAIMSIAEVFKDILPEYRVGQVDTKMTTLRKSTLERVTYENALLQQFKKYLQKLERITGFISKKGGGKRTPERVKLAEVAVICLCDLLSSHPYFNYVQNIAQLLVYMLNSRYPMIRERVNKCFLELFKSDQKLDMTLFVVRRINHLIKSKQNIVQLDVITCLLALRIKNVNLDAEKENELKQKKLEAHRQRLLSLSKRERKRRKKLAELDKELQETRAEENKQSKLYKLTEIIKMVFTIYFRILKNDPSSKLLSACLEGLAEFAHVINLEFFSDLIEVLHNLLESGELDYRQELHCIQTIFVILSGQGEVLNIDPIRFYGHLYRNLLVVHAGKNHQDFLIILRTLHDVLIKRRKNITQHRMLAFIKRMLTLGLHLLHNGTLGGMGIVKTVLQLTSALDIILDTDCSIGSGIFDPHLDDPEYCNANCTALYELALLRRHYHPTVRKIAMHIANGVPATGDGSLPPEIGKLTPEELFTQFDSTEMSFNPSVPVPKNLDPKPSKGRHQYLDESLKKFCRDFLKIQSSVQQRIQPFVELDFYKSYFDDNNSSK